MVSLKECHTEGARYSRALQSPKPSPLLLLISDLGQIISLPSNLSFLMVV